MTLQRLSLRQWIGWTGFALVFLLTAAVAVWRGDILRAGLDPQIPFQTYVPPPAPDYRRAEDWALLARGSGQVDVFFLHSTTFDGGRNWNGPLDDRKAERYLNRVVIPNYAAPFALAGSVSAPRYRQASLYTRLSLREDSREARAFAYRDIEAAFETWLERHPQGPIVLAGVEQGGELLDRLINERIKSEPTLRSRVVAVYLVETVVPKARDPLAFEACRERDQAGCVLAWAAIPEDNDGAARRRLRRALIWDDRGRLVELAGQPAMCVNPVNGTDAEVSVPARLHRGATNATDLEWGGRPALMARVVATECRGGLLRHNQPTQESFRERGSWADRRKSTPYNLFYGDIAADVQARTAAWTRSQPRASNP